MREQIYRKDPHVNEIFAILDEHLEECGGDIKKAVSTFKTYHLELITPEIDKVADNSPAAIRYYLENYHVINTKGEGEPPRLQSLCPFKESQEILWADFEYCIANKIPVFWILLKARQVGWSTLVQAMVFYRTIFNRLIKSLVIADEKVRAGSIFSMSRLAYDNLPYWMQPEIQYETKDDQIKFDRKDKDERMRNPGLNSTLYCDAANKPSGSSRGMTLHCMHASEVSRYNDPSILSSDIFPAIPKNNPLTVACLEGTAEGRKYFYRDMWEAALKGRDKRWRPIFTGWWQEKTYFLPFRSDKERKEFIFNEDELDLQKKVEDEFGYTINPEQMNWRRAEGQAYEAIEGDFDKVEQEYPSYPESAFRTSGKLFFPKKRLNAIEKRYVRKPFWYGEIEPAMEDGKEIKRMIKYQDMYDSGLWVWEMPEVGQIYYLGADPGHGIPDADRSAICIWKIPRHPLHPYVQVAEYQGYADPTKFAKMISMLGNFYNECEIAPECNTITQVIADLLNIHSYPSIYRWRRNDKLKGRFTNYFGWETNVKSRNYIMSRFRTTMNQDLIVIRSSRLIEECFDFVDDGTGRFESSDQAWDDTLFSAMIALSCAMDFDPSLVAQAQIPKEKSNKDYQNTDYAPEYDEPKEGPVAVEFDNL